MSSIIWIFRPLQIGTAEGTYYLSSLAQQDIILLSITHHDWGNTLSNDVCFLPVSQTGSAASPAQCALGRLHTGSAGTRARAGRAARRWMMSAFVLACRGPDPLATRSPGWFPWHLWIYSQTVCEMSNSLITIVYTVVAYQCHYLFGATRKILLNFVLLRNIRIISWRDHYFQYEDIDI